jgi:hypothetical protein
MPDSIYDVVELVGTSTTSWEDAVQKIVAQASKTLRDLRIAEILQLDAKIDKQEIVLWRARVRLSFKYEGTKESGSGSEGKTKPKGKKDVIRQQRR